MSLDIYDATGTEARVANKTYYLDADQQLTDDDEKGAFLLVRKGVDVPADMQKQYPSIETTVVLIKRQ